MTKEILIFGASSPLGQGVTNVLLKHDYDKIFLFDRKISNSFNDDPNISNFKIEDLSIEENVIKALSVVKPSKEKELFLFSSIGGYAGGKFLWETETSEFDDMILRNLKINYLIAKHFSLLVKQSAGGSLCFTSAYVGLHPEIKKVLYEVSKAALIHLIKSLALEGKEINLSVNGIAPYMIDTPANRQWISSTDYEKWTKPEEIGELVHNLFASYKFISGNTIFLSSRFAV
jgi:NAD(P)-dependent dehydrogenase (short-subunit alcohol dehydrogenase family)